ncbi:MAG: hypothetical protein WA631_16385 [Nitrososphaeraceae archaeon]
MKREEIKEEIRKSYLALGGEPNPLALAQEAVKRYYYETWDIIHNPEGHSQEEIDKAEEIQFKAFNDMNVIVNEIEDEEGVGIEEK